MNGTSIDNIRMMQQMPPQMLQQPHFTNDIMTGDGFGDDHENNMDALAKEVSDNIDDLDLQQPEQQPRQIQRRSKGNAQQIIQKEPTKNTIMHKIPEFLREPLLLVLIYILLSLDIVKKTLANYIPQIKPAEGSVAFMGIAVYAIILAIVFIVTKKLIL
jgi:hypothetical protein